MTVGAYYFDGWSGRHRLAEDPSQPWAKNAPTHLTQRMLEEFPEREPVWGWRDDSPGIMERQIDLAADHGLSFFAFCWYWHDDAGAINTPEITKDPKHTGLNLFLKASNNRRLKFCLLVANHPGFRIEGREQWKAAAGAWMPYLKHPQYLTVGGRPLLIIFQPSGADPDCLAAVQEAARDAGLPGLSIAGCGNPDAASGYTHRTMYNAVPGGASGSEARPYADLVASHRATWKGSPEQPCIPVVTSGWDKRPWEGPLGLDQPEGWYFPDRTPEAFGAFLRGAGLWMEQNPEQTTVERIALIYAWNELGEGGHLVPTRGDPDGAYLKALRGVALPPGPDRP